MSEEINSQTEAENFSEKSEEKEYHPIWVYPDFRREAGEVERVLRDFLLEEPDDENVKRIITVLKNSPFVELDEQMWSELENTDSFTEVEPGHIEDARKKTEEYNEELPMEDRRDFEGTLRGFIEEKEMKVPIVVRKDGVLHLLGGNTRLMIARALKVKPKVIILDVN